MAADASTDVTRLLRESSAGNEEAFAQLMTRLYEELSRLASQRLRLESPGHTLGTTGLVHEAYLRLVDQTRAEWRNREQFFAVASEAFYEQSARMAEEHPALFEQLRQFYVVDPLSW